MNRLRRRSTATAVTFALAAGLAAASAEAATHYVDIASRGGRCSDARTAAQNTIGTPWCSLDRGVAAAPAGSTVLVRAGTYPRLVVDGAAKSAYTTVAPYAGEVPSVHGATLSNVAYLRFRDLRATSSVTLADAHHVDFAGGESALEPAGSRTPTAFALSRVSDVTVADRFIHDGYSAVNILATKPISHRITVQDNRIERMGNDGVYVGGATDVQIVGNDIIDVRPRADMNRSAHSDAVHAVGPTTRVTVADNLVRGGRGFLFHIAPPDRDRRGWGHVDARIVNNVLAGNSFAIRTRSLVGARIANNTVWGTTNGSATGVNIHDRIGTASARTIDLTLANNIMKQLTLGAGVGFAVRDFNLIRTGPLGGPHDVAGSPTFRDLAAGDLRLVEGSEGVDAASSSYAPPRDRDGLRRVAAPDAGAFELQR